MCGRFTLHHSWADVWEMYNLIRPEDRALNTQAQYNIAPTKQVPFVSLSEGGQIVQHGRWWLVPHWAKEIPKYTLFNARSEDAYKKPSFRDAFKSKRCLIPADGYYEWTKGEEGNKDPHYITLPDDQPFSFAGLWAHNTNLEEPVTSCTILTAAADSNIEHLHKRMPLIIPAKRYDEWLSTDTAVPEARELLSDNRGGELVSYRVDRAVNKSGTQGEQLIEPLRLINDE